LFAAIKLNEGLTMDDGRTENRTLYHTARIGLIVSVLCGTLLAMGCAARPGDVKIGIKEGQIAPDFKLEDLGGQEIQLSDYRGQVVLINFWATWCSYCRTEFPEIQRAYESNREAGFVVLAVNVQDRRQSVEAYAQELGLTIPVLLDPLGRASASYKARGLPTSYFVDPKGVIVLKQVGPIDQAIIERVLEQAGAK
jgi:peroxiredoxin